jgi:hypothetical protein
MVHKYILDLLVAKNHGACSYLMNIHIYPYAEGALG